MEVVVTSSSGSKGPTVLKGPKVAVKSHWTRPKVAIVLNVPKVAMVLNAASQGLIMFQRRNLALK